MEAPELPRLSLSAFLLVLLMITTGCLEKVEPVDAQVATSPSKATELIELQSANGVRMLLVPGGTFAMGNPHATATAGSTGELTPGSDEQPVHEVQLSAFVMDRFEVTQDQYAALELPNPSHFKGERRPVEQVRWSDAALFCNERSLAEGLEPCYDALTFACDFDASGYRLPTEAEWEYAARAGSVDVTAPSQEPEKLEQSVCYAGNSRNQTKPAGSLRPNAWGFYDMQGNVAEWCHDVYSTDYYATSPTSDPRGPDEGPQRVVRGGSWKSSPDACRTTARQADDPGISDACFAKDVYGFRCVRKPKPDELAMLPKPAGM